MPLRMIARAPSSSWAWSTANGGLSTDTISWLRASGPPSVLLSSAASSASMPSVPSGSSASSAAAASSSDSLSAAA